MSAVEVVEGDSREVLEREIGETAAKLTALRRKRREIDLAEGKLNRATSPRNLAIKRFYVANEVSVSTIARLFSTSAGAVQRLARELNWPRRSPPKCEGQRIRRGISGVEARDG